MRIIIIMLCMHYTPPSTDSMLCDDMYELQLTVMILGYHDTVYNLLMLHVNNYHNAVYELYPTIMIMP